MHVWNGKKPNLIHLKSFGCIAYIHTSQGKLSPRATKGVFIGYPSGVKGYKVWLLEEKKCAISRNVIFHELATVKTNLQDHLTPRTDKVQFEVESSSDHHSQDILDETNDQEDHHSSPYMLKSAPRQSDFDILPELVNRTKSVDRSQQSRNMQSHGSQYVQEVVAEGGDLSGNQLARDKSRREIKTPIRYAQADLIAYAFSVGDKLQSDEPATFEEAC